MNSILFTFDVSKLSGNVKLVNDVQPQNIYCISVALDVSKLSGNVKLVNDVQF